MNGSQYYYHVERLVMEATGRYEFTMTEAAYRKNIPVCIAKPLNVRRYAGATDRLAKTDKIDAALIAEYAAVIKPKMSIEKSKTLIIIKDLLSRRRQLMNMRTKELNRIKIMGVSFEVSCKRIIRTFDKEIERMEIQLNKHVVEQEEWSEKKNFTRRTWCWKHLSLYHSCRCNWLILSPIALIETRRTFWTIMGVIY